MKELECKDLEHNKDQYRFELRSTYTFYNTGGSGVKTRDQLLHATRTRRAACPEKVRMTKKRRPARS